MTFPDNMHCQGMTALSRTVFVGMEVTRKQEPVRFNVGFSLCCVLCRLLNYSVGNFISGPCAFMSYGNVFPFLEIPSDFAFLPFPDFSDHKTHVQSRQ